MPKEVTQKKQYDIIAQLDFNRYWKQMGNSAEPKIDKHCVYTSSTLIVGQYS